MTPIGLVESDDEDRITRAESDVGRFVASRKRDDRTLYGPPQHERECLRETFKEAYYGAPQHDEVDERLCGEPFPWLLEVEHESRQITRTSSRAGRSVPHRRAERDRRPIRQ